MKTRIIYFVIFFFAQYNVFGQAAATTNYATLTGSLGTTYSWIDCSAGTSIVSGDDAEASFAWPFTFSFYDNTYTTTNNISVSTNGIIRFDGTASTAYTTAQNYTLSSTSTELGQIIAMGVYDGKVGDNSGWTRFLVSGTAPDRILTIEYNNLEIDYNDNRYVDVQVSFYETINKIIVKLGQDGVRKNGVDIGIHSGINTFFNKWQEVRSGTNSTWIEYTRTSPPVEPSGPAASWNYGTQTGTIGSTYSWIDCSAGTTVVSGDDAQASILWPFDINIYDNLYTTDDNLSVATNGFIRLDGTANTDYTTAQAYSLESTSTGLGQIIALGVYDGNVGDAGSYIKYLVTGSAPNRIFTIEYNNYEIDYNDNKYADVQVSFFESSNKIVLLIGNDNVTANGADLGIHSGINTFFNDWQEVASGTNNTWIEYSPPFIEVNATNGTSIAYYPAIKGAFDKINDGTHQGDITIKINSSTTESSSAILNASGTGSSNYSTISIYPTETGLSISGNMATPLIDLNGADNVTIDGRVNATGTTKDLSIVNSSTSTVTGTSTIRFINGATNNIVKYSTIKGSETDVTSGVLFFSSTSAGSGNSANTIDNNNISNAANVSRPVNAIYSLGTIGKDNSGNIISNNAVYDFLKHSSASNGIFLSSNTSSWTINANSFYETTSFIPSAAVSYSVIQIANSSGHDFIISNNHIGGSTILGGGTAWTKSNAANNVFHAININVGTATASSVQNNTIRNFNWSNSSSASWSAISVAGGDVNIGTSTGNTIGSATGTGSVTVTGALSGLNVYGIYITSTGTVDCQNNTLGSITSANGGNLASNIYAINKSATAGTTTISNNDIGSTSTANSINASSASTANAQVVYGIYNGGTGTIEISNNNISKLKNGTTNNAVGTLGVVNGIASLNGTNTISNNSIYDLSIANANTNASNSASVCGMALSGTVKAKTVTGNTIYNLSNTYASFAGNVIGVFFAGGTSANAVSANFIHSLLASGTSSTTANIYGIKIATGATTFYNNIINLGGNTKTSIYGIYETGMLNNNNNLYFNTVYVGGSLASGSTNKSYALYSSVSSNERNFRNNIFMNARSTTSGADLHYAAFFNYSESTNITLDYNDYFVSGTGGAIAYWNAANIASLPIISGQDVNSLITDPNFTTPGGTVFLNYYTASALPGVSGTGILTDYEGITHNIPPKMGALASSLGFIWQGNTSTDFATPSNWENGLVPLNGVDISFAATPANDCYLDQNRTINNLSNTSAKKFIVNGKQLTLTGMLLSSTANQIDASGISSVINFSGTAAQSIPDGVFVSNTIDGLTVNNSSGFTQNGDLIISTTVKLTDGEYKIGANTLTINGAITTTAGAFTGGSSTNIVVGGSGASTILPGVELNNITLNRSNGISLGGPVSVAGTLILTSGTMTLGPNTLTISGNTPTRTSGNIDASNAASTIILSNLVGITIPTSLFSGGINNLSINGGGITVEENITVNGILDLQTTNPSTTKGLLDMTLPNELIMGANATNDGAGDVTGIITRNTILANHNYTFGNKNTWATYYSGATTLPDFMKVKVLIGADLWGDGTVQRVYELIQENGDNSIATFRAFYLDSELNGNAEDELSFWSAPFPFDTPEDNARSNSNVTENWLELADVDLAYFPSSFGQFQISINESNLSYRTWSGRVSDDWNTPANWAEAPFPGAIPTSESLVVIPDASTTDNDPTLPPGVTTEIMTIALKSGSILNSGDSDNAQLSFNHNIGTWSNSGGTFNPGNSTVNFIFGGNATVSGTTTFNNIFVSDTTFVTATASSYIKVKGGITISEVGPNSGELRTRMSGKTTVEYNGINQTITNPIVLSGNNGYYKLILSGSGTKTMPTTAMTIADEFVLKGTLTATAQSPLSIGDELEVLGGATFFSGVFNHTVGGHFDVGGHLDSGTFTASGGSTITLNGTSIQNIYGGSEITFENLVVNNTTGVDVFTDIAVNNALTLTTGNLNVGAATLTINGSITKTIGFINTITQSSFTFGGTTALMTAPSLFASTPNIKNLTINRTGGVELCCDFAVNGILNLQSANPSDTKGCLEMGTHTLLMVENSTTVGIGDVTGKIMRTTILPNVEYTFGNQFSSVTFPDVGTLPTELTLIVDIGTAPSWKTDGVKRIYDIAQVGASATSAVLKSHYLDSELNGLNENDLGFFSYVIPNDSLIDRGHTEINTTDNWMTLSNLNFGNLLSIIGLIEHGFGVSIADLVTWDGSVSDDWYDADNWTPAYTPDETIHVIIPDAATTPNDPLITPNTSSTILTLDIRTGGILNAGADSELTLVGSGGAWENLGTFNHGTGKVIFSHGDANEVVTISGETDFYNIEVGPNTTFQPVPGNILSIAGAGTAYMTSIVDFSTVNNTVEWKGSDQTIVNPNGIGGNSGYYNLILSGSGTKTMPGTQMNIVGDFSTSGSVSLIAAEVLVISGNTVIGNGSTFETGNYDHLLAGYFENNGTFTPTSGGAIMFHGTSAQTISGSSTTDFDGLCINNLQGVAISSDVNVNNELSILDGFLNVGANTLGIYGTISNPSGYIDVSSSSSLSFGGTTAITVNNNLFNSNPTINNLTVNRSGGVTLGNESITVNGTVILSDGTLTVGPNTLTIAGNSPTRTSGDIDASNSSAKLVFTNPSALTLPGSVFNGNINNLTVNGAGVNIGGDISINGILSLASANQSATVGSLDMSTYTLNMGASATTTGTGDVTGIVKRQHTFADGIEYSFGNQFTSLNFLNVPGGIKPTWVSCKIEIGTAPSWRSAGINRFYSFAQSGGTDRMSVKLHYLDSELHGAETDESELVFWDAYDPDLAEPFAYTVYPRNHNNTDATNNWIQLTGPAINYLATSSSLDVKQWGLSYSNVTVHEWIGLGSVSYPGDWSLPGHWDGGVPQSGDDVLIPTTLPTGTSGYPYRNLLPVISPAGAKTIEIEPGASIASDGYDITVSGYGDAWVNDGTFNPGTGTVIFSHGVETEIVLLNGTTNFYDLHVEDKTQIKAASNCITRIAGIFSAHSGSILDFIDNLNTVEYNGSLLQTVVNPVASSASGYHHLILSGTGTKKLPASSLYIGGDLTTDSPVSASDNTLVINGSVAQSISGTVGAELNNLTISNTTETVTASVDIDCSGSFTNSGVFDMTAYDLGVTGTVTNSGTIKTSSTSSTSLPTGKTWGGTVQYYATTGSQTTMAGTYNNLTLSNTSGTQTASGNLTVNASLITTSGGLLDMGTNLLLGTLSTITNGGTIQTQNTSSTPIPTGKTWGGSVEYNALAGGQTVMAGTYSTLAISNTGGIQAASGAISATTLNTAAGGTFNMVTYAISSLTTISNLGTLRTQNTSSTPFTSGLTWGGTVTFDGSAAQTLPTAASIFNNLTISNTTGVTAAANQTVNGILNLSVANPDATHGSLDMSTYTLNLGANSTTTGVGDATGIIARTHTFVENTLYSFGHTNQIIVFPVVTGQTLPTSIVVKISLVSTAPTWLTNGTKRKYQMMQTGAESANPTKALFRCNYLDTELASGVNESLLAYWFTMDGSTGTEFGWSNFDISANWITLSNVIISNFPTSFGASEINIAPTGTAIRTWDGSESTDWDISANWTPSGVPTSDYGIIIPDASTTDDDPELPSGAEGKFIILESGSILDAASPSSITLSGVGDVWSSDDNGIFYSGTNSTVSFTGADTDGDVSISGSTSFNNLTISSSTLLRPGPDSYMGISGDLTNNGILAAATNHNIIEFKKSASFTIPNPNGSTPGYHSLIISGTGTKTLPTPLKIWHDFTNNGTVDAGTGTVTMGTVGSLEGVSTNIGGSSSTTFYNLINNNVSAPLTTTANISIGGTLTINSNTILEPGATYTVGGSGTLTGSGTAKVTGLSSINSFCSQYLVATYVLTNLTVDYNGAGDQTVCAEDYGNMHISPNGTRTVTLASTGTIGISGVFNPDVSTTSYTITGSTLVANGTGSQTVPAFNYYNVNVTGDRSGGTITLVNGGTIGIAGHSTVTTSNANFVITNNTIDFNGSAAQTIDPFSFFNVIFSNAGVITTTGDLVVYGSCTVNSGSTLNMDTYTLSGTFAGGISSNGTIKTANTSATPLPAAKTWDGTIDYTGSAAQTVINGTYNNLTMSGVGGGTAAAEMTVNGVLNLSYANPSSTKGILSTDTYTLNMGASATTTGTGDVTGIVKRQHTFADGIEYSFGNQYTSLNFLNVPGGIKPTWVSCKIEIGTAPSWRSAAINRFYSFAQSGGTDRMIVKLHYLDSELHGAETDESKLVFWDAYDPDLAEPFAYTIYARNQNDKDATNNWIQLTGPAINYIATSSTLDVKQWGLSYTNVTDHTWIGLGSVSYPGDWSLPGHWDGGVPQADNDVLIPATLPTGNSGYPYRNLLPVISPANAKTIEIESGATLNVDDYDITISGASDAWVNNGIFNAGTGTVIFSNGSTSNTATLAGTTNFNNLSAGDNTKVQPATNNISRIAGTLSAGTGSILDFGANVNTVEYNGDASQTVTDPGSSYGYHSMIFSGNGTKTLPSSTLNIFGDLTVNSAISVIGNTLSMAGTSAQIIDGTDAIVLNNLTIDNAAGVTLDADELATVKSTLLINSGKVFVLAAGNRLAVPGTITNNAGTTGLVIRSTSYGSSGTGFLNNTTSGVEATVERYMSGDLWHLISPAATGGETVAAFTGVSQNGNLIARNTNNYGLAPYTESDDTWDYYKVSGSNTSGSFGSAGTGFQVLRATGAGTGEGNTDDDGAVTFRGTLAAGDQSVDIVQTGNGWNLIGNPYPCGLNIDDFLLTNASSIDPSYLAVYVSDIDDVSTYGYTPVNKTGSLMLASGEGYFVKSASGSNTVDFTTSMKSFTADGFKSTISDYTEIVLTAEMGNEKRSTQVNFIPGMTNGLDPGWDAGLFNGGIPSFSLATRLVEDNGVNFAIQCLPEDQSDNFMIPIDMLASKGSTVTFRASVSNLPHDSKVYLEDRLVGTYSRLDESGSDYSLVLKTAAKGTGRFYLHSTSLDLSNPAALDLQVVALPQQQIIRISGKVPMPANAVIYDMLGRMITTHTLDGSDQNDIHMRKLKRGMFLLRIESGWVPFTKKFYWVPN